jgi:hypothetical protein
MGVKVLPQGQRTVFILFYIGLYNNQITILHNYCTLFYFDSNVLGDLILMFDPQLSQIILKYHVIETQQYFESGT